AAPTIPPLMALGVALAVLGRLPGFDMVLGGAAWLLSSALLAVIEGAASLPGAVVAVGRAPDWLPWLWYAALGGWVAAGSADVRALGVRAGLLRGVALACPLVLVGWLAIDWVGAGRSAATQVVLLDIEPAAAFIRTPSGRSALLTVGGSGQGLAASVGAQLDLTESAVDVVIGPGGPRIGVDLLELPSGAADDPDDAVAAQDTAALEPGTTIDLGEGVTV